MTTRGGRSRPPPPVSRVLKNRINQADGYLMALLRLRTNIDLIMRCGFSWLSLLLLILSTCPAFAQLEEGSVPFRIAEVSRKSAADSQEVTWLSTHESAKAKAQFLIVMQLKQAPKDSSFSFSKGSFRRVPGSKPGEFIKQLSTALAAKKPRLSKSQLQELPFDIAILGSNLSRGRSGQIAGGFVSKPQGTRIATKVFLANGEGEVFLNIDPASGVGEFSIKDEEYGDIVVEELSKVL